jgi:DNA-binding CsgD family transcriptional regulator
LDMIAQGKDFKEISVLLGESQNKVKQIIAVSQSKDVAESKL